jgi:tetratricopeptide (TPR) repeat protein
VLAPTDFVAAPTTSVPPALAKGEWPLSDRRLQLYERALRSDPHNHFLLLDLAREYGRHRRLADADRTLERLLELYPASANIRLQAAEACESIGLPEQALDHYDRALALDPTHPAVAKIKAHISRLTNKLGSSAAR